EVFAPARAESASSPASQDLSNPSTAAPGPARPSKLTDDLQILKAPSDGAPTKQSAKTSARHADPSVAIDAVETQTGKQDNPPVTGDPSVDVLAKAPASSGEAETFLSLMPGGSPPGRADRTFPSLEGARQTPSLPSDSSSPDTARPAGVRRSDSNLSDQTEDRADSFGASMGPHPSLPKARLAEEDGA